MRHSVNRSALAPFVLTPALLACAHAPSHTATAPRVSPDLPGVAVTYRMLDGDGVVLSGRSEFDAHYIARVDTTTSGTHERLELEARPRDDGTVLVQVRYEETRAQGSIDWRPSVRLARGATAHADMTGSGWKRLLEISVD